ncbi:MAG: hypothetical protein LBT36_02895, partial [Oscillospiraceae bacterium]|nr:hypothetical protein [Oscillospiraceae bacterium]
MNRLFKKTRLAVILVLFVGLLLGYVAALYKMQIYDALAGEVVALAPDSIASTRVDRARRGDVLDRNGVLLISSTATYNVALSWESLRAANYNEIVRELVHLAAEMGVGYNDTFPVTLGAPFSYRYDIAGKDQRRFEKYLEYFSLEPDITASDLVTWMKDHYKIPYTMGISDARLIIGVRYELEIRYIPGIADAIDPYIFAQDVGLGFVARLEEKTYPGVSVEVSSKREYFTQYAAHLLGYVSKITATQLETSKEQGLGYPLDAVVGQTGAEQAFEQYLRGTDGATSIRTAADGSVISEVLKSAPIPGQNVYLTIDIRVQEAAEKALASLIADINLTREDELNKVPGGAVVAVDVRSGEVLAMASYPTFDITTLLANFSELNADKSGPLYNRATQGTYTPGST